MKKRDGAVLWVCRGWITEKEDGGCGRRSVATAGLLLRLEAVRRRPVRGERIVREMERGLSGQWEDEEKRGGALRFFSFCRLGAAASTGNKRPLCGFWFWEPKIPMAGWRPEMKEML
uniref:Uncharacterized protein n=1 Tax=Populus davidiana TaxID=266767 RepID=A0A6M2EB91_9ROSI